MTVDKDRTVKIPIWLISFIVPFIVAGIVSFGAYKATSAKFDTKIIRNEIEIEKRVTEDEFNLVIKQLDRIEKKLDEHIQNAVNVVPSKNTK